VPSGLFASGFMTKFHMKRYKLPGTDQVLAEFIQETGKTSCSDIAILIHSV
jgi:hypothetical protein